MVKQIINDILSAPPIVRAASLDSLSPTIRYTRRAIVVDQDDNFLGFAQYKLFDSDGPRNFFFEATSKMAAAGIRVPNFRTAWFRDHGPYGDILDLGRGDAIAFRFIVDGVLY